MSPCLQLEVVDDDLRGSYFCPAVAAEIRCVASVSPFVVPVYLPILV